MTTGLLPNSLHPSVSCCYGHRMRPRTACGSLYPARAGHRQGTRGAPRSPPVAAYNAGAGSSPGSFGTSTASRTSRSSEADVNAKRAAEFAELVQEAVQLAIATGPRGAVRALQGVQALLAVAQQAAAQIQAGRTAADLALPPLLRLLFEKLGATYIKLGQFVASSPTLFPEEYVLEFQKCLDATEPVPWPAIRATLRSELASQGGIDALFSSVDEVPLASASVAQVHSAVLRSNNQRVVIKVLKPGVEDVLTADLNFLLLSAKLLEFINPELSRTSLAAIVGDIRSSMLQEVDFLQEAAHVQQFSNYLDASGMRQVATCPYIYRQFSTSKVLVMERLDGVALTDLDAIRGATSANPEATLINALNTWFGSLLGCETFHADVHAGNLLVLSDGRVGFIDFGIVGRISPSTWAAMQALLAAISVADCDLMARSLLTMGATSQEVDIEAFAADLGRLFESLQQLDSEVVISASPGGMQAGMVVDDVQVNRLLLDLVRVADTHGIRFPREFGLLVKQLLYFDRYTRILAPELEIMQDSRINLGNVSTQFDFN